MSDNSLGTDKIIIKKIKKQKGSPSEIRIDRHGNIFLDGELYEEGNPKYKGICMSVEKHQRIETGEETQKMIDESKKAVKGETVVITDIKTPNRTQKTTVKF